MPGYCDLYVLAPDRNAKTAFAFLDTFAVFRDRATSEYLFPRHAERPDLVLTSPDEAIQYCFDHPSEDQAVYFRNLSVGAAHVMLFFTSDSGLILGLSVLEGEEETYFSMLKKHANTDIG